MKIDLNKHAMIVEIRGTRREVSKASIYMFRRIVLETQASVTWRMLARLEYSKTAPWVIWVHEHMQVVIDNVSPRDARRIRRICKDAARC